MKAVKLVGYGLLCWCIIFNTSFGQQHFSNNEVLDANLNEIDVDGFNRPSFQNDVLFFRSNSILSASDKFEDQIKFFVYTKSKNGVTKCDEIKINDSESVKNANLKKKKVLKILIHGFISNCSVPTFPQNIIEDEAHVAGIAGDQMQKVYNSKIGRITGLDPAGPSFESFMKNMEHKLDKTDAKFVDVIHTNVGQLGISESIAHADFFPNGGERQPLCYNEDLFKSLREAFFGSCSHRSSSLFYERSIGNKALSACPCTSKGILRRKKATNSKCSRRNSKYKTIFGENCPTSTRGSFCLDI